MRATDVMTAHVITVSPATSVQDLAVLLSERGISGVPVVDDAGQLIGIVSEGDLLHRAETSTDRRTDRRRARWFDSLSTAVDRAQDYVKSHGRIVGDVMTREVITVTEATGLDEIADLMETRRIKRVPVVRDGKVVGIVSRANLVRALAAAPVRQGSEAAADDSSIRHQLLTELRATDWASVWASDILVRDRVVHIWCSDDQAGEGLRALRVAAENIPGVKAVEAHIVQVPLTPLL